jgi:tRNA uridine 5-carbamoylmethylation protein Kti12
MKIILLIGLPCSGKTTFLSKLDKNVVNIIDDPKSIDDILLNLNKSKINYISDCNLCLIENLNFLNSKLNEIYQNLDLNYLYFENNIDKWVC